MKLLIVCDAMKKFIGKNEYLDKLIAKKINNFDKKHDKEGVYCLFLQRVVDEINDKNKSLNAAVLGDDAGIPSNIFKRLSKANTSVCFRQSIDPFENSDPNLSVILNKVCGQLNVHYGEIFTGISIIFVSNDVEQNKAVVKSIKNQSAFKDTKINIIKI